MVKSYLKFEHTATFAQINSASSNVVWLNNNDGKIFHASGKAVVGANEEVLIWDLKNGELDARWREVNHKSRVTVITRSLTDPDIFAVGYEDGKIRLWDAQTATAIIVFNGHRSAITVLKFDSTGARLISGGRDTDIIVWDLVSEVGLFKLRGHTDQITSLNLVDGDVTYRERHDSDIIAEDHRLLSTSKDGLIKVWDLSSQTCVETHVAQANGECWALAVFPDGSACITAGNEGEMRVWSIKQPDPAQESSTGNAAHPFLQDRGSFYRNGKERAIDISFHPKQDLLAIHGLEKAIEIWRIRTAAEIQRSMVRKQKRKKEKGEGVTNGNHEEIETAKTDVSDALVTDIIVPYAIIRTSGKVRSIGWTDAASSKTVSILVAETTNQLGLWLLDSPAQHKNKSEGAAPEYLRSLSVDMPGHRSDIRCLAISSDDRMLASASQGSLKIWNLRTNSCIRTLDCSYALCMSFLPGDKIVIVGTRDGKLEIFDVASSYLMTTIEAHEKDVWSMQVSPDGKSLVTGSADKTVKFWQFKVLQEEVLGTEKKSSKLTLTNTRTLKLNDDILSVRFSPDSRFLAVSTLDTTVKVFFLDSLKPYLTLYGHKLPVLSIDISYDSKLVVTSSADKNIRIWGLDFGDCHRTFFAHQDSILAVLFVPNNDEGRGHHFFSASKDKTIKYFDGDKFEVIEKLENHHGEIWAMALTNSGNALVSASHDKSIRVWTQTDEQIFLEEEREKELEDLYENTLLTSLQQDEDESNANGGPGQLVTAGKQTAQTLMAGEKITEALELALEDLTLMKEYSRLLMQNPKAAPPQRNPNFLAHNNVSAMDYVLETFQRIPSASLHDALLVLSFSQLPTLFVFLQMWAEAEKDIALVCRVLFFMVKIHQKQIVSNRVMKTMLEDVKDALRAALHRQKNELGYNIAGAKILRRRVTDVGMDSYVDSSQPDQRPPTRKRAFLNIA